MTKRHNARNKLRGHLFKAGINQPEGASLQVTVERGWCFGSEEFREKMSLLVGDVKDDTGTTGSKANGYNGSQTNDHAEATARLWIARGMEVCGLSEEELATMNKTDWRKAMIVRGIRKHSSVKLDWIARELHMGVRSGITRAEQMLKTKLKSNRQNKNPRGKPRGICRSWFLSNAASGGELNPPVIKPLIHTFRT